MTLGPATHPCGSCPCRKDAPSGVWHETEYAKLPEYDKPTTEQPQGAFLCHQQDGHLCAGWVGCHDMNESLALRLAAAAGSISLEEVERTRTYESPVPLFGSGQEAADHGGKDVDDPGVRARRTRGRLLEKLKDKGVTA